MGMEQPWGLDHDSTTSKYAKTFFAGVRFEFTILVFERWMV
jgi:hypothetical protein